jgi:hypothetical protein
VAGVEEEFSGLIFGLRAQGGTIIPNGKLEDNPLSDLIIHGVNHFPDDVKDLLLRIDAIGRREARWPLGENWPFSPREFDWAQGRDLDEARDLLRHYLAMLEADRGDAIMIDPLTQKSFHS